MNTNNNTSGILKVVILALIIVLPAVTFAVQTLKDVIDLTITYLGYIIPFIISLSMVVFLWGIYKYFFKVDTDKKEAQQLVLWGVVGFFLMVSFWGLVNILIRTFNLENRVPAFPAIQGGNGGGTGGGSIFGGSTGGGSVYGGSTGGGSVFGGSTGGGSFYTNSNPGVGKDKASDPAAGVQ